MRDDLLHPRNAIAMWTALADRYGRRLADSQAFTVVAPTPAHQVRAIVREPPEQPGPVAEDISAAVRGVDSPAPPLIEDPFGRLDLAGHGFDVTYRMPVMLRPPGPHPTTGHLPGEAAAGPGTDAGEIGAVGVGASAGPVEGVGPDTGTGSVGHVGAGPGACVGSVGDVGAGPGACVGSVEGRGVVVVEVRDEVGLAEAERVIVAGFPRPGKRPGELLPAGVLDVPGWRTWVAYRGGVAAAAGYTFDDGVAAGLYLLATLPEHRGRGAGAALVGATLRAHPERAMTLTATAAGTPLYARLGFHTVSRAVWWVPTPGGLTAPGVAD